MIKTLQFAWDKDQIILKGILKPKIGTAFLDNDFVHVYPLLYQNLIHFLTTEDTDKFMTTFSLMFAYSIEVIHVI